MAESSTAQDVSKVDSGVGGLSSSPVEKKTHKKTGSTGGEVWNPADLEKEGKELSIAPETQKLNWKINTSTSNTDNPDALKKPLTNPLVKKIDLVFPLGSEVTARNLKGVLIKDALDAIYKQYKKRSDEDLENPVLAGFEWDKEESWTKLKVHLKKEGAPTSKKAKKDAKKAEAADE